MRGVRMFVLVGVFALTAGLVAAQQETTGPPVKLAKDEIVVLKFPSGLMGTQDKKSLGMTVGEESIAEISADASGRAVVGGVAEWQTAGFPSMMEMRISKVKLSDASSEVALKSTVLKFYELKLKFKGDASKLFPQVVTTKQEAEAYRKEAYAALAGKFFTGPLGSLPDETKTKLIRFAHVTALGTTIGNTTYKDNLYLVVDLGRDDNVYNDLKLNQSQRVAEIMNGRLLTVLKAFAEPVKDVRDIYGLKLELDIPHKSFLERLATATTDKLELYAPSELIRKFAEADITSQQLMDGSVAMVNGNRVQVALAGS